MSSHQQRIRRDEFDIESIEAFHGTSRSRSRSTRRTSVRRYDDYDENSRSRSRSIDRRHSRHGHRDSRSLSRSRSRSRSRSGYKVRHRRDDRRRCSRYRDDSRSNSRSRSRSYSPTRYSSDKGRDRRAVRQYSTKSRSRSRSSSHFRDFGPNTNNSSEKTETTINANRSADEYDSKDSERYNGDNLEDLPLPEETTNKNENTIYQYDENELIERERIHKEMAEKLRATLAKEGKIYPPPKAEASHPVFANDGSFLELFKKMQQQQQPSTSAVAASTSAALAATLPSAVPAIAAAVATPTTAPYLAATALGKSAPPPPMVGRRRGGKILKTGVVAKPKAQTDASADPKDFWSLYLAEVNKYKNTACESEQGNRPLVK